MLLHYTTRTFKSRRLDSHQHEAVYGTAAFLNRATSAFPKGVRGESNPPPRPSQSRMPNHYTTDTMTRVHLAFARRHANAKRKLKYPDQDSNPERLVRSEV